MLLTGLTGLAAAVAVVAPAASAAPPTVQEVASVVEAVTDDGPPLEEIPLKAPSERDGAYVAKLLQREVVRAEPRSDARRVGIADRRTSYLHQGTRLMILEARYDGDGQPWLRVLLPTRPNDATGWIRAEAAVVERTVWGVLVNIAKRELRVYRSGKLVRRARVVVGKRKTPTPVGLFAVYEVAPQRNPKQFTGPWALNVTAHSTVLENYGSGLGRVAIHGRAGKSLRDPLGSARSHGCVRINNAHISWMARNIGNGTPVRMIRR